MIDPPSPGAKRMREYRRRRRYGLLSIRVRVARVLIDALIEKPTSNRNTTMIATKLRSRSVTSSPTAYKTRNGGWFDME